MDIGRRPYKTACRPFRDDDTEVTVHWYSVPKANGTLGFPCRINSLDWRDFGINPAPVGEVTAADREFDGWGRIVPPPPGDHVCGRREDFELGGLIGGPGPPLTRAADGIPTCCRAELGGMVLGGDGQVQYPHPLPQGGLVMDGGALRFPETSFYDIESPDPEEAHLCYSEVPPELCSEWRTDEFGADWRLTTTASKGTVGDWTLRNVLGGQKWEQLGWDGVDPPYVVPTLVEGSWPSTITIFVGI